MASLSARKSCEGDTNTNNNTEQPQKATIDASKLNALMESVDQRLAGGLHGDYFEKGSKLDDKHRNGQLETVFGLRKELSEIKTQLEKQNQQADNENVKPGKGAAAPSNKSMIATIKTVVQQELSEKIRDLSVHTERLRADVMGVKSAKEASDKKVKTLETKLKKAEERIWNLEKKLSGTHFKAWSTPQK